MAPHMTELFTVLPDPDAGDNSSKFKLVFKYKQWNEPSPYVDLVFKGYKPVFDDLESRGRHDVVRLYKKIIWESLYLGAGFDGATVITKPFRFEGNSLHVNAKSDHGSIGVKVLDEKGRSRLASETAASDSTDIPVRWKDGGLSGLRDKGPIRLKITLRNAKLYSFWIDERTHLRE